MLSRRLGLPALVLLLTAAAPAAAQASTTVRYAAPGGATDGTCTTVATACTLSAAVAAAPGNSTDEIVLTTAGSYAVPATITDNFHGTLDIHPAAGIGRPTLTLASEADLSLGAGSTLRDVDVVKPQAHSRAVVLAYGSKLVRVRVTVTLAPNNTSPAVELYGGAIVGSEIAAVGPNAIGLQTASNDSSSFTAQLLGDTIVASGTGAVAASFSPVGPTPSHVQSHQVVNTIFHGTATDLRIVAPGQSEHAEIWASAYATVVQSGTNAVLVDHGGRVTAAPKLAGAGDLHEAAGAPTVDAGTTDGPLAALAVGTDLDGDARTIGGAVDIGADELVPKTVLDDPPSTGTGTPDPVPAGAAGPAPTSDPPSGGTPAGPVGAPPAGPTPGGAPTPARPAPAAAPLARLVTKTVTLRGGRLAVRLRCAKGGGACAGTLTLMQGRTALAKATVTVAAGRTVTLRLRPTAAAAKRIRRFGHAGRVTTATIVARGATGHATLRVRGR